VAAHFGEVPFFFFLLHLLLIHAAARLWSVLAFGRSVNLIVYPARRVARRLPARTWDGRTGVGAGAGGDVLSLPLVQSLQEKTRPLVAVVPIGKAPQGRPVPGKGSFLRNLLPNQ
jgi:hypothetical protein